MITSRTYRVLIFPSWFHPLDFNEGVSEEFGEEFYEPLMENEDEGVRPTGGESPLKNKTTTMQAPR